MKKPTTVRIAELTALQLEELQAKTGFNQTQVIQTAIDRMYREEIKTMNRADIDKLFGSDATDKNLKYMADNWTVKDVKNYLNETGYNADPNEVIKFLKNFR